MLTSDQLMSISDYFMLVSDPIRLFPIETFQRFENLP